MSATLTVIGAGAVLPREGYGTSGYALRPAPGAAVTLLDCGPGTVRLLPSAGIALAEVQRVVVSHFHPDHCLDLLTLAFARRNPAFAARAPALELVGPRGLGELLEKGRALFGRWVEYERTTLTEVAAGETLEREDLVLRCAPARHTPEALAWRAETRGGESLAYTGDTGESDEVADLARGVDLFVAECAFPPGAEAGAHLSPEAAGRMAARAGCARLLLSHFYPDVDPEEAVRVAAASFPGPVDRARDGSTFALRP